VALMALIWMFTINGLMQRLRRRGARNLDQLAR
jgi:hypothetical protein